MNGIVATEASQAPKRTEGPSTSEQFLNTVSSFPHHLIMTHNNPDPDGIAAGWAVSHLLREKLHEEVPFIAGGEIIRAENREMIRLLRPPLRLTQEPRFTRDTLVILVDCSVEAANHPKIDPSV